MVSVHFQVNSVAVRNWFDLGRSETKRFVCLWFRVFLLAAPKHAPDGTLHALWTQTEQWQCLDNSLFVNRERKYVFPARSDTDRQCQCTLRYSFNSYTKELWLLKVKTSDLWHPLCSYVVCAAILQYSCPGITMSSGSNSDKELPKLLPVCCRDFRPILYKCKCICLSKPHLTSKIP